MSLCNLNQINVKLNNSLENINNNFLSVYKKNENTSEIKNVDMKNVVNTGTDDVTTYYNSTLFEGSEKLEKIDNLLYLFKNNSYVQNIIFSYMFCDTTLKFLDSFDGMFENTKKMIIVNLSYMFKNSLLETNISMRNMFSNSSIYESQMNSLFKNTQIRCVDNMYNMFNENKNLKYVNFKKMFEDCVNLNSISINNIFNGNLNETYFDTKKIFKGCNPLHLLIDFYYDDGYKHKNYDHEIINKFTHELPDYSYIYIDDTRKNDDFEKYLKDENTNSFIVVDKNGNCFIQLTRIQRSIIDEVNEKLETIEKNRAFTENDKFAVLWNYTQEVASLTPYNGQIKPSMQSGFEGIEYRNQTTDISPEIVVLLNLLKNKGVNYGYVPQIIDDEMELYTLEDEKTGKLLEAYFSFKIKPTPIEKMLKEKIEKRKIL